MFPLVVVRCASWSYLSACLWGLVVTCGAVFCPHGCAVSWVMGARLWSALLSVVRYQHGSKFYAVVVAWLFLMVSDSVNLVSMYSIK